MPRLLGAVIATVLAALVLSPGQASAHAALVGTDPADGGRLDAAPKRVTLTFSENVATPAFVVITAPDGSRVRTGKVDVGDKAVTTSVAPVDIKGTYTMAYRVVSADGHPVEGSTTFVVTTGRTVTQTPAVKQESFTHRHRNHLLWGILGALVAVGLLLWPLRSKNG